MLKLIYRDGGKGKFLNRALSYRKLVKFNRSFSLFLITFLSTVSWASQEISAVKCQAIIESLRLKSEYLNSAQVSIDSLLGSESRASVPLNVLFQVDLQDEIAVKKRIADLSKLTELNDILQTDEFINYKECSADAKILSLVMNSATKQADLNLKRLLFLNKDRSERDSLLSAYETLRQQGLELLQLENQLSASRDSLIQAQAALLEREKNIAKETAFTEDEILLANSNLEQFVVAIEKEHIEFIDKIKSQRKTLEDLRERLLKYTNTELPREKIGEEFYAIDTIWKEAAKGLLEAFKHSNIASTHFLPKAAIENDSIAFGKKEFQDYLALKIKAQDRSRDLLEQRQQLLFDFRALNFRLVSESGRIRAQLISHCREEISCEDVGDLNENTIAGISTELRILPLKLLGGGLNKFVEFKAKLSRGIEGWADILRQAFVLLGLLILPILVLRLLRWVSEKLDRVYDQVMAQSILDYRRKTQVVFWVSRLHPFVPSLGMVTSIHLARALLETTDLQEFSSILFYFELYFVYRFTRLLLTTSIGFIFSADTLESNNSSTTKVEASAKKVSLFFFSKYVFLHIIEDSLRRAFVFHIAYEILNWISVLFIVYEVHCWRDEILQAFQVRFEKTWLRIKGVTKGKLQLLILPFLLVMVMLHDFSKWLSIHLIRFNFFKLLFSEVYKRKLEQNADNTKGLQQPSATYLSAFDYFKPAEAHFYIERDKKIEHQILDSVQGWLENRSSENVIALVGNQGIGKTTSLKWIFDNIHADRKYFCGVPAKIATTEDLFSWLSVSLRVPVTKVEDFIKMESALEKKIVIVLDDVHNMFVSKLGGFAAYRQFLEIINLQTAKIFWCFSTSTHAWTYLKGVYGEEHFHGKVHELKMWSDIEIQKLISNRHEVTEYSRLFDNSISAYAAGGTIGEKVESHFFRLLWGQSRGNPRSALMYWISALSEPRAKEIYVGVPKFIKAEVVSGMSNNALIILAGIARHDNLSLDELEQITYLEKLVIRTIIKESIQKQLVWMDANGRIRIASRAQHAIEYYLIGKNFLYE